MSEFECRNHHLMKSGEYSCRICGERIEYTDGMSRNEMRALDAIDYPDEKENEDEE